MKLKKLKKFLDQLYLECEHGDDEHRKWLKDKFDDFLERYKNSKKRLKTFRKKYKIPNKK